MAHLRTFDLNNFKIIVAMGLKLLRVGPLEWHYLHTKFHENLRSGSKVINGGQTDRQFDKPTFIFGNWAKNYIYHCITP
jgi:hypothetical protein